jgi:hypothetical protein
VGMGTGTRSNVTPLLSCGNELRGAGDSRPWYGSSPWELDQLGLGTARIPFVFLSLAVPVLAGTAGAPYVFVVKDMPTSHAHTYIQS